MSDSHREYEWKRTRIRIAWFFAVAIVGLAVVALVSGRGFSLGFGGESGAQLNVAEPGLGQVVDQNDLADVQPELETRSSEAVDSLSLQPSAEQVAEVSIGGTWVGAAGLSYQIVQQGAAAAITEFDQFGNITAYGEGVVEGPTFSFQFTTAAFTSGIGSLTIDGSGTRLQGSFSDAFGTRQAVLQR